MSTPIETNTEELQEILNTVYNLPNRNNGGSSSEPDLVLSLNLPRDYSFVPARKNEIESSISVKSGSIENTLNKVINREEVKVFLEYEYYYGGSVWLTGTYYPINIGRAIWSDDDALTLEFLAYTFPGVPEYYICRLGMAIYPNGTFGGFEVAKVVYN